MPITEDQLLPLLRTALPSFDPVWEKELAEFWYADEEDDEDEGPGLYNMTGTMGHHLVDLASRGDSAIFPSFFNEVERLLGEADADARELLVVGLIESLLTISSHTSHRGEEFREVFGPRTRGAWDELIEAWTQAGGSLLNILRAEKAAAAGANEDDGKPD